MSRILFLTVSFCLLLFSQGLQAQVNVVDSTSFSGLKLRNIGPAFTSGRIADIAIHPEDNNIWYVAVGSGGVWKTENAGITWKSLFDGETSYSTGSIALDPRNPNTIWVGTGENVGGRHVAYGDGIYKSSDGGQSWRNMGLKDSEHLSTIIVHPDNSDVVWVAAQGPLWSSGGERGVYKTTDGGETWTKTLGDDEWVGATDIVMDPRDPMVLYAATWQRHRTVANYLGGGPGTAIHKSTDGGLTWIKSQSGIPGGNLGKIGLAISYHNPDQLFAAIELQRKTGAVYMSDNRAGSWKKMSDTVAGGTGPHYYQELYTTPHAEGTLYLMNVRTLVSTDYGATFKSMKESKKHSDNHAIAFRPDDPDYLLVGSDGGLFESLDGAENWRFIDNLPITQYYKVAVDDALPFYNIFGGTQDNGSHGGPSRTDNQHGIRNADWFKTLFADGHQSAVEPGNPNIVYAETQQGGLYRIDLVTGEPISIQPQSGAGEKYERFNWDGPIVISPHDPATLYFASYRVWKSINRGDSWTAISEDLTRDQERFELPIMGGVQSWDNAWDLPAMSVYNTISSLAESPVQAGLVYAGTDDGIIQVSEDDGGTWTKIEVGSIAGIPATAFVNNLYADLHDANTVYAALDNHKYGDFQPYLIKSSDRGQSWTSLADGIPDRTLVWRIVQDHVDPNIMFLATEFGIYFTLDGGDDWKKVNSTANIAFRDITIQKRENDVVAASFGRGFFILDDYSPLREVNANTLGEDGQLFSIKDAQLFRPRNVHGGSQGAGHYEAPNPPFGAILTYYIKEGSKNLKSIRKKAENDAKESGELTFPGWEALDAEKNEVKDTVEILIKDTNGSLINRVKGKTGSGIHRAAWNLRYLSKAPIKEGETPGNNGFLATPGQYSATLVRTSKGIETQLSEPVNFNVVPLYEPTLKGGSPEEIAAYRVEMEAFQEELALFSDQMSGYQDRLDAIQLAHSRASNPSSELSTAIYEAMQQLIAVRTKMSGSPSKSEIGERNPPSPRSRSSAGIRGLGTTYGPTELQKQTVETAKLELANLKADLSSFDSLLSRLSRDLEKTGAPSIIE